MKRFNTTGTLFASTKHSLPKDGTKGDILNTEKQLEYTTPDVKSTLKVFSFQFL